MKIKNLEFANELSCLHDHFSVFVKSLDIDITTKYKDTKFSYRLGSQKSGDCNSFQEKMDAILLPKMKTIFREALVMIEEHLKTVGVEL